MYFLKITWVLCLVVTTECSLVKDESSTGIYINDYCPRTQYCPEGTHVLCLYYDNLTKMSPRCGNGSEIEVTDKLVNAVLKSVNNMRRRVLSGEEVGKDGQVLPKAYGLLKVRWDPELATFAQIWANQCVIKRDFCRATKNFPKPSQFIGRQKYNYLDWAPLRNYSDTSSSNTGLNNDKVHTALLGLLGAIYSSRNLVTKEMINRIPDDFDEESSPVRHYLTIVSTGSTHVGCGIATHTAYAGMVRDSDESNVNVNEIHVVCNFAASTLRGNKVYETEPPTAEGWTPKCGCPPGFLEAKDCLCVTELTEDDKDTCGIDDEQSVVVLPIFEVENAPLEKLYHPQPRNSSSRKTAAKIIDTSYNYGTNIADTSMIYDYSVEKSRSYKTLNKRISDIDDKEKKDVRKRYFNAIMPKQRYRKSGSSVRDRSLVSKNKIAKSSRRDSIFTKVSKFELPVQNNHNHFNKFEVDGNKFKNKAAKIIQDVTPRKDFSKVQELATAYLKRMHNKIAKHENHHMPVKTEPPTNRTYGVENFTERDKKLLGSLTNPDQEVNHDIKSQNIKEMIGTKINGNILGNSHHVLQFNHRKLPDDLIDDIENENRINKLKFRGKNIVFSNFNDKTRSTKRKQNSIKLYDKPSFIQYRRKYGTLGTDHGNYFEKIVKPFIEGRTIDKHEKDAYNVNKNSDAYQNSEKMKTNNYFLHAYHQLEAKKNFFRDRLSKLERRMQSIRDNRHRNEEYRDNGHHVRPVIGPSDYRERTRLINKVKIF